MRLVVRMINIKVSVIGSSKKDEPCFLQVKVITRDNLFYLIKTSKK